MVKKLYKNTILYGFVFFKNEYLQIMFNFNDSNYEESDSIVFGASILYRIADVCPSLCFRESS